ncbi:MAG: DUF4395 domain-containing protein, partial [Actinomycetota bacterium]
FLFGEPIVVAVALALIVLNLVSPSVSPVARIFRVLARPPQELEPVGPVRFAQGIAVVMLAASGVLFLLDLDTAAWTVDLIVAAVALLSAVTGVCVGCEAYRLLMLRTHPAGDLRADLGLAGRGPWIVVLTAPGCARCEPVARELERVCGRDVVRVNIMDRPAATSLPVRSVPAALAVAGDGSLRIARAGRLGEDDLRAVATAV